MRLGLTFDDVLLVPRRSDVTSRSQVDTRSRLTRRIEVAIPIVSANMDAVTESEMAIAMAREGGLGVIHRFLGVEQEVAEVRRVKRAESIVIEQPYIFGPNRTVLDARAFMEEHGSAGLLVVDGNEQLLGMVTARDLLFAEDGDRPIASVMTPRERLVTAPPGIGMQEARTILHQHRIEKLPLVDDAGRLRGLITSRDIQSRLKHPLATKDAKGRLRVGAAVGIRGDYLERAAALVAEDVDALVLDVAHGHTEDSLRALVRLRERFTDVDLIAGNVATADGTQDLIERGADAVKAGVGPGSTCTTRIVTGAGVPQLTSVLDCAQAATELGLPLVADGGIRRPADLAKAIAAGGDTAMVGSLFAGTRESPGEVVERGGRRYKVYRGMASRGAAAARPDAESRADALDQYVPEGVETVIPLKDSVTEIVAQLVGGLRSGMSYVGARGVAEFRANAEFIRITAAGMQESKPGEVDA